MIPGMVEQTFGERVRAMRIERNLSLESLAAALPKKHHLSWLSKVEKGTQDVLLSDIYGLAEVLSVSAGWLIHGDAEETEFTARLRGMEAELDERGKRTVIATAAFQVEETKKRLLDGLPEDEAELLRRYRELTPRQRSLLLAAAGEPSEHPQETRTEHQEDQRPRRQAESA